MLKIYKNEATSLDDIFSGYHFLIYHAIMFMSIAVYILVYIMQPKINAFFYITVLLVVIKGADWISKLCVDREKITIYERKLAVGISSFILGLVLLGYKFITGNDAYLECAGIAISVIIGFFVPLDVLVGEYKVKEIYDGIKDELDEKRGCLLRTFKISIGLVVIVVTTCISPIFIGEEARTDIFMGFGLGTVLFIIGWYFMLLIWLKRDKIEKIIWEKVGLDKKED